MKNFFEKLISWLIFVGIEVLIGYLLSKLTFCNIGKVIMVVYCVIASILAFIFGIGLDEGDF